MTTNIFCFTFFACLILLAYVATKQLGRCVDWLGYTLAGWSFDEAPDEEYFLEEVTK